MSAAAVASAPGLPRTQRAILAGDKGEWVVSQDAPVPELEADNIIIKTVAVALNPVDTKMVGPFIAEGAMFGFDCAGYVVAIGSDVASARPGLKVGDRVCGCADGMNKFRPRAGAFGEYVVLDGDMALKIPESMGFEEAAGMGMRIATAGMALFWSLGIPTEWLLKAAGEQMPVLVYGGSTSTGTMAIQLLKLCNVKVITTCSPRNFDLVRSYGADAVFDYSSPTCGADIRAHTANALDYALDCITEESSMKICYQALGRCGGKYTALDPHPESKRKVVEPDWILASMLGGKPCSWPAPYGNEGDQRVKDFAKPFFETIQKLFDEGRLTPHPTKVSPGGFEGLAGEGVTAIRKGQISGQKLVYRLDGAVRE
ncbi:zinc-binding dehydrogenase family [Diaporthe eres]|uniref:Enoyl reductase (ER) domain-containing protein n=1 Tax=Diaporthe vaccinii TaxID=105482 RepID=A0ABR4F4E1_9PEZI|nr:zinc-binding dehydrogenase family [Diaporthe eres]